MNSPNVKHLWAELIIEELTRCGVTEFCISPGSRNTPLVLAVAGNARASTVVHPDERGAAFYAVGFAKASGMPAALICTSGTAVANYLPALIEASMSSVPMIVLSCDRPADLRDTGANQTIDQVGIFGGYTRWSFDMPSPNPDIPAEFVLTTVDQMVYRSLRAPAGPVHLNCMFAEPLTPEPGAAVAADSLRRLIAWQGESTPFTTYLMNCSSPSDELIGTVRSAIERSKRGAVVVGRLGSCSDSGSLMKSLDALRMPIMADISSGLRFGGGTRTNRVTHYDLFMRDNRFIQRARPDLILHLGGPVVSNMLNHYIQDSAAAHIVVDRTPFRQDPGHSVTLRIEIEPERFCESVASPGSTRDSGLLSLFCRADAVARDTLGGIDLVNDLSNDLSAAFHLLRGLPSGSGLFLANSMPVRDADGCGVTRSESICVGVNRGASGIDGSIATAVGFGNGLGRPVTLLTGDLAFLHDMNSLLLVRESRVPMTIVLLNNNGGGMFSFLPIAEYQEHFERFFGASHGLGFARAADIFGLGYSDPATMSQFDECIGRAFASGGNSIIEIRTDRRRNLDHHRAIWEKVAGATADSLGL